MPNLHAAHRALHILRQRADLEVLSESPPHWHSVTVARLALRPMNIALPPLGAQVIGLNCGSSFGLRRTVRGRTENGHSRAGHVLLYPPDADTKWLFEQGGHAISVTLDPNLLAQALDHETGIDSARLEIVPRFLIHDLTIERLLHELLQEARDNAACGQARAEALASILAVHLIRHHSNLNAHPQVSPCILSPGKLRRIEEFIEAHLADDLSLTDMAKALGMGMHHFCHAFHAATGKAAHRYLIERRVEKACMLLSGSGLSLAEIALAVGLHDQSHFTRLFHRAMGTTPRQFRRMRCG